MRRTLWWLGGTVALAASACGGGSHHTSAPTTVPIPTVDPSTSQASTTSTVPAPTTTTVPDPVSIPPTIDITYVNAVLAQLNHVYGNARRIEVQTKFLPKSIPPLLRAIYGDPQYARELSVFSQALVGNSLSSIVDSPPDPVSSVTSLAANKSTCLQISVSINDAAASTSPVPTLALFVVLRPKIETNDPSNINPTPWAITYELSTEPGAADACS
jgi:hypothetical protein